MFTVYGFSATAAPRGVTPWSRQGGAGVYLGEWPLGGASDQVYIYNLPCEVYCSLFIILLTPLRGVLFSLTPLTPCEVYCLLLF